MELYINNNVNDITYPERSYSLRNNFGIPKRHKNILLHSGSSELILDIYDVKDLLIYHGLN